MAESIIVLVYQTKAIRLANLHFIYILQFCNCWINFLIMCVHKSKIYNTIHIRGVPNSGFRLFNRIQIVLWTIWQNTNSVAGWAFWRCTCCSDVYHLLKSLTMLSSHDPLPFIHLIVSQHQVVWVTAAGTDWVKLAVDVSSTAAALYRLTMRIRSDDTIRPNTNTLFGPLFGTEANIRYIPNTY